MMASSTPRKESKRLSKSTKKCEESVYDSEDIDDEFYLNVGTKVEGQFEGVAGTFLFQNFDF